MINPLIPFRSNNPIQERKMGLAAVTNQVQVCESMLEERAKRLNSSCFSITTSGSRPESGDRATGARNAGWFIGRSCIPGR